MSHLIIYKDIEHERFGDAPFIGALLIAQGCNSNCSGCFNQHLKEEPNKFGTATELIHMVKSNPLNEGIILGGLEWTEQPYDMMALVNEALQEQLHVMIYTRLTEELFLTAFPGLVGRDVWCKFGAYDESQKVDVYFSHGVRLATANQCVKYLGSMGGV